MRRAGYLAWCVLFFPLGIACAEPPLRALIVDGQNNHDWRATTPLLRQHLEQSGLFRVEVATAPSTGEDLSGFRPRWTDYHVVVLNYNGELWPEETRREFAEYVRGGGGVVVVHAANNAFPEWAEYNRMIGLGGWGGRDERSGPYVRVREGRVVRDTSPGVGGSHGAQHAFQVVIREPEHPITAGLPRAWMHANDELYDRLRGPAEELTVLATAWSDPATGGSGEHEPMLMTIAYGKGRVFHTTLGHSPDAMRCVGFIVTYVRGAEWAATGKVTQTELPADFPTSDQVSVRE